jgi:type VI secretion system secreted protein Hcp
MPSDAFMELSTYAIMGETSDVLYGRSDFGGFEISSIDFHVGATASAATKTVTTKDKKTGNTVTVQVPDGSSAKTAASGDQDTRKGEVTITKSIDQSSAALFQRCCEKKKVTWGILTIREPGDNPDGPRNPWLTLELRELSIKDFSWDVDPAASGDEAMKMEKITFEFEQMYIRYQRQDPSGLHKAKSVGSWDFAKSVVHVAEIGDNEPDQYD